LRERNLSRDLDGAKITLNEYLDRWLDAFFAALTNQRRTQIYAPKTVDLFSALFPRFAFLSLDD